MCAIVLAGSVAQGSGTEGAGAAPPIVGQNEIISLVSGDASVRQRGTTSFIRLTGSRSVPDESEVDATRGRVAVTVAMRTLGQTVTAEAYSGRFIVHQDPLGSAETHLVLSLPLGGCKRPDLPHRAGRARARAAGGQRRRKSSSRRLWVSERGGSWGTNGRYVSTSVEGTRWLTADSCRASRVKVGEGVVRVHDLIHGTTTSVTAGDEYVAAAPPEERPGYMPPLGDVLSGETGGDPFAFGQQVGKHVAVFGFFSSWYVEPSGLLSYVQSMRARLLLHISTDVGYGSGAGQEISPRSISMGTSDGHLLHLCSELAMSAEPVYVALLPEMNQANNAYSAFNADGSSRGASNSTAAYRQAWRRTVLILRGGSIAAINQRLHTLRLPALRTTLAHLPQPKVSFMWAPQTAGTPDTPANSPAAYYPGGAYVDIVGTDFYSAFPNFSGLSSLYSAYPSKPFGFNEWAMWQNGNPSFVSQLFAFVRSHQRIALMVYNEGLSANGPFRLKKFPAATAEIRRQLHSWRFLPYPPE
jgi:hypothetical protein